MDSSILLLARQIGNGDSEITAEYVVLDKARQYMTACEVLHRNTRCSGWMIPEFFPPVQNFPEHIVRFLCAFHWNFSLYYKCLDSSITP